MGYTSPRGTSPRGTSPSPKDYLTFHKAGQVITWISRKQTPFAHFQSIAKALIAHGDINCGAAMLKSVETRSASRLDF
jgi:hypothetical protein